MFVCVRVCARASLLVFVLGVCVRCVCVRACVCWMCSCNDYLVLRVRCAWKVNVTWSLSLLSLFVHTRWCRWYLMEQPVD